MSHFRRFNVDLLKYDENADTEDFINNLYEHLFIPFISGPTRFNVNSSAQSITFFRINRMIL